MAPGFDQADQTVGPFIETGNRTGSSVKGKEMLSSVLDSTEFELPMESLVKSQ